MIFARTRLLLGSAAVSSAEAAKLSLRRGRVREAVIIGVSTFAVCLAFMEYHDPQLTAYPKAQQLSQEEHMIWNRKIYTPESEKVDALHKKKAESDMVTKPVLEKYVTPGSFIDSFKFKKA